MKIFLGVTACLKPYLAIITERVCVQFHWHILIVLNKASHSQKFNVMGALQVRSLSASVVLLINQETFTSAVLIDECGPIKLVDRVFENWYMYWCWDKGKRMVPLNFCLWEASFETMLISLDADSLESIWPWIEFFLLMA